MPRTKATKFNLTQAFSNVQSVGQTNLVRTFISVPQPDADLISRYKNSTPFADLKSFCDSMIADGIAWLRRMVGGTEMFDLETMKYWKYNEEENTLVLCKKMSQRNKPIKYAMDFTMTDLAGYNNGMGNILNSFWYKTYAFPLAVVELIAACDLLYRKHHNGRSPAHAAGIPHMDLD